MKQINRFSGWSLAGWLFGLFLAALFAYAVWNLRLTRPNAIPGFLLGGLAAALALTWAFTEQNRRRKKILRQPFPENWKNILQEKVGFYHKLPPPEKIRFEQRVLLFLGEKKVSGIGIEIDDTIRLLVAASAVIPIFHFPHWDYYRLEEVLIYPGAFHRDHIEQKGLERNVLGMVGEGDMNRLMILSQPALISGFQRLSDGQNTGIHEFVHLLDGSDGEYDGIPGLLDKQYILPWLGIIHREMKRIARGDSRLRDYGAANKVEFFAVASEYFFEKPADLQKNYPELYAMLEKIFRKST